MSKGEDKTFTLEELPAILYQKLDGILAKTSYQSLQSLAGSSHEQIVLLAPPGFLDIWIEVNDGTAKNKPNGTIDLYHVQEEEQIRMPHLRFFCDILFGELKIRYLQHPEAEGYFVPNKEKKGELEAYSYTLGWFSMLEYSNYR